MEEIIVIVKAGHTLSDKDFWIIHATYPHVTEYFDLKGITFEHNIMYQN
jgi:hypothetical protein